MPEPYQLNVNDRVLLHLSRFATDIQPEEFPPESTQAGIAIAVGISRTHIPRAVRGLIKDGLVNEITARVKGHERRMNVYVVTAEGRGNAERLWGSLQETLFSVLSNGETMTRSGRDLETMVGKKRALAAVSQMRDGVVRVDERRRAPVRDLKDAPHLGTFYGREEELKAMDEFMDSEARVLVVLGNRGFGTTALAKKFVDSLEEEDVLWISLRPDTAAKDIESRMIEFGKKVRDQVADLEGVLRLENTVIVLDDYFSAGDDAVELFYSLVESAKDAKIVVSARQETPAYNWFYQKKHVDSGTVREIRIKGLDDQSAKRLLGNDDVEKDALKRIMMMTRGQPMILKLLKSGDMKGLKENTVFTVEEIRYLMFLKDRKQ
jgi:DNA-binding MarR family transcriptional regulator